MALITGTATHSFIQQPNTKFNPRYQIQVTTEDGVDHLFRKNINTEQPLLFNKHYELIQQEIPNGTKVTVKYHEHHIENKFGVYTFKELMAVRIDEEIEKVTFENCYEQ